MEHGAKVHIIIQDPNDGIRDDKHLRNSKNETCRGAKIPLNQTRRLKQRCEAINRLASKDTEKYKRAIFTHVDSRRIKEQIDVFFYHLPKSTYGRRLATNIWQTIDQKYKQHQPNRGFTGTVSSRRLYVLRNTSPVATFLELGNIQNERDRKRLVIPNNRQALANWICQGIIKDYKSR
jgi:N-acetylmuramoyl-L-alanine amidase